MAKIISWNVNGLRALHRKGQFDWLLKQSPDIFCLQEVKATEDQLPQEVLHPTSYVSHITSPKTKKGYSGVATWSKVSPKTIETHMDPAPPDEEGRMVTTFFKDFVLCNVYFPNGGGGPERLSYKLSFYDEFLSYIEKLRKKGHSIIFCGDINTAHEEVDLARPKENEKNTGFLPEERAWLDEVVNLGYVDVHRFLNPNKRDVYTYWDMKTRARERNVGWRIDYFFVSPDLASKVKGFTTHTEVLGSDHCPIELDIEASL
jgi:exodeoxyribonuclease-3